MSFYSTLSTIAAPFSLFGSSAMLYVISRSRAKLSTTLNRLLVGLCVGDIIFSLPMLFSKAIITYEDRARIDPADGSVFSYTVPITSNQAACSTQGFIVTLGAFVGPLNNCALCIYYVCVIKLNMSVAKIKKNVEPYLHAIPWMTALIIPSIALATRSINPTFSMCQVNTYIPKGCESDDCVIGKDYVKKLFLIGAVQLLIVFMAIIVMMAVVFLKVWRQERRMSNAGYRSTNAARAAGNEASMIAGNRNQAQASRNNGLLRQNVVNSRKVLNQALAYAGAYFATWFFFLFYLLSILIAERVDEVMFVLATFFFPLQGFFNFLVFVYPRVTQQLRGNDDMNVLQALCAAIRCIPIPPRNRRNRGAGNGAAAGTATGRGGNGATGNTAATAYGSRNISLLRGTAVGAGNADNPSRLEPNESLVLSTTEINVSSKSQSVANRTTVDGGIDDKKEQRMHNGSGPESLAIFSQQTVSTATTSLYSIGEVGGGESQIEEEMGQEEEKTEIEERMTIADEEVAMLDTAAESYHVEGEHIEGNGDIDKDEETGVLKNDTALLEPSYLK